MPDFDKLHELSTKLADLTNPVNRQTGLATWALLVGALWEQIALLWGLENKKP